MKVIYMLLLITAISFAWTCPACGTENDGEFCSQCGLIEPPDGMEFVPACSVTVDDEVVFVPAFYIDSQPVACRDVLSWLSSEIKYLDQAAVYLTGQESLFMSGDNFGEEFNNVVFVKYTPWVIYIDQQGQVSGITVQTGSFDYAATGFTFDAARLYLSDIGKHLPTRAEYLAAVKAGAITYTDTWEVLSTFSDFLSMTISSVVGIPPAGLSMFADSEDPSERIMWEWTEDAWSQSPDSVPDIQSPYAVIMKPLDPVESGTALRENGYFNVIYRGVVSMPWYSRD